MKKIYRIIKVDIIKLNCNFLLKLIVKIWDKIWDKLKKIDTEFLSKKNPFKKAI